jgi:hypothetical protein
MFETRNDLPEAARTKTIELLNARLADCKDLQTQIKQAHWNVKGPNFIALHKLFDEINDDVEQRPRHGRPLHRGVARHRQVALVRRGAPPGGVRPARASRDPESRSRRGDPR